jgi:uncharacterized tellurite resistance protein B-like protein
MNRQLFYKEFGRLLYALAAVDGQVSTKEADTLKRIVKERLVPHELFKDHFGSDQAFTTEFEFDVLVDQDADADACFDSFIAYMSQHRDEKHVGLDHAILRAADEVANAFHGVNKKELGYLVELRKALAKH